MPKAPTVNSFSSDRQDGQCILDGGELGSTGVIKATGETGVQTT